MRRSSLRATLALSPLVSLLVGGGCDVPAPRRVPFAALGRLDPTSGCQTKELSALQPAVVRLSVRIKDASGQLAKTATSSGVCDAFLDDRAGKVEVLPTIPAGGTADFFVEAFDSGKQRIATGALLDVKPDAATLPTLRLLAAERFSCLPATPTSAEDGKPKRLRLFQHRAFHSATRLPNGQVLLIGGVTTTATGDSPVQGTPEQAEGYFLTGAAEVYDPSTQSLIPIADSAPVPRAFHQAAFVDTTPDGRYRVLLVGGVAPKAAGMASLSGLGGGLDLNAPADSRFRLRPNATVAASEIVSYDPVTRTIGHAPVQALAKRDGVFQGGAPIPSGGLFTAGGLQSPLQPPVATTYLTVTGFDPSAPNLSSLAFPRAASSAVASPGLGWTALLVGGLADGMGMRPPPFEVLDLAKGTSRPVNANGSLPVYIFPTVTVLDPTLAEPRVLVSGGLEVQPAGPASDPPDGAMHLVRYTAGTPQLEAPAGGVTGWMTQSMCLPTTGYKSVAWNAATLLYSDDGVLNGDRVLLTGGTPRTQCNECMDAGGGSHTCAVAQAAIVGVPVDTKQPATLQAALEGLQVPRFGHTQTLLPDHTVLIAGGLTRSGGQTLGAVEIEIYNPARSVANTAEVNGTGDADDPLKKELQALHLSRAPAQLAVDGTRTPRITCAVPTK